MLAASCMPVLTADLRATADAAAEALAAARAAGEARGEERRAWRPLCSRRAARCAEATLGFFRARTFGVAESFTVLNDSSAARLSAMFVESMRMEVRAGEEAEVSVSWRRGRVVESRDS